MKVVDLGENSGGRDLEDREIMWKWENMIFSKKSTAKKMRMDLKIT